MPKGPPHKRVSISIELNKMAHFNGYMITRCVWCRVETGTFQRFSVCACYCDLVVVCYAKKLQFLNWAPGLGGPCQPPFAQHPMMQPTHSVSTPTSPTTRTTIWSCAWETGSGVVNAITSPVHSPWCPPHGFSQRGINRCMKATRFLVTVHSALWLCRVCWTGLALQLGKTPGELRKCVQLNTIL